MSTHTALSINIVDTTPVYGQSVTITGTLTTLARGKPLKDKSVTLLKDKLDVETVKTNDDGAYAFVAGDTSPRSRVYTVVFKGTKGYTKAQSE